MINIDMSVEDMLYSILRNDFDILVRTKKVNRKLMYYVEFMGYDFHFIYLESTNYYKLKEKYIKYLNSYKLKYQLSFDDLEK